MRWQTKTARALARLDGLARRWQTALGVLLAAVLSAALALHNVSSGPLRNLNDIGGWENRALFIAMTAAVHLAALLLSMRLGRVSPARMALRQLILTAGLYILLLPINQKTYAFSQQTLPLIRAMDAGGIGAAAGVQTGLSAPAIAMVYAVTRGPVYDMYMLKLLCIGCVLALSLLAVREADRRTAGLRAEALLALCMILPQGFMNAACSALPEIPAVLLLGVSLLLLGGGRPLAGALCYGGACALSGACLYALPVLAWLAARGRLRARHLAAALGVMLAACLPAIAGGMPAGQALGSLLRANFGLPAYASGAPGMMNLIPRAAVEETAQYAPTLRHLAELDVETFAQPFYTQAHFEAAMRGFALAGLAMYLGLCAYVHGDRRLSIAERAFALTLGALIVCSGVTSGAWLALDLLGLYAIVFQPGLRLPACLALLATAAGSCCPMTEETLLPMVCAFALCLLALLLVLGVVPMPGREEEQP